MPKPHERAVFIGQTGSGKSTLARFVLRQKAYTWVFDPNGLLDWDSGDKDYPEGEYMRATDIETFLNIAANYPRIIFTPDISRLDDFDYYNQWFQACYLAGNVTVYIDEVYAVTRNQTIPHYYKALLTRGRIKGISVYSSTQRPSFIPSFILSESENIYTFRLQLPADVKKVETITGLSGIRNYPKQVFSYCNSRGSTFTNLKLNLKG